MREIQKDSTNQSVVVRIIDATDGTPELGVVWNTAGIDMWYRREGAVSVDITEATLALLSTAHTDGGFLHINDGYYRLDLPDAAVATGANGVMVGGAVTGMIVIGCYVHLTEYDPQDAVRLGLTALANAVADAAGGLPISDAGGLDLDTILGRITANVALASVCTEVRLAELAAANLPTDIAAIAAYVDQLETRLTAARAGYLDELGAANLPADIDTLLTRITAAVALASVCTEGRLAELDAANLPTDIATAQSDLDLITGADGAIVATGGIAAAAFVANAINAAALAADAVTEITAKTGAGSGQTILLMIDRIYRFLMNKIIITDADGSVALRNEGDVADIMTQTITDNSTLTTRTAASWV